MSADTKPLADDMDQERSRLPMVIKKSRALYEQHQAFFLLLMAFISFRMLSIVLLRPGGFVANSGPDQYYYFDFSRFTGSGQLPFFDFWMEYPPLMPWLATIAYRVSLNIPVWDIGIFWFNLLFRLLLLPFDVATLVLIYLIVGEFDTRQRALQVAVLWALLFAPLLTLLSWFDPLTLFFLVLGLYGLLTHRPMLAGAAIGFGFMAKILPVAIAPAGLFALTSNRQRSVYVCGGVAAAGLVIAPPLLLAPDYIVAWFRALSSVTPWETIWALLEGYASYGQVAHLSLRHDPTAALFFANPEANLPWFLITPAFAILYGIVITRKIRWDHSRQVTLFALFSVTIFILHSKGFSPQWTTYLCTMALLALPAGRGLGYGLLLGALMIAEWPFAFVVMADHEWFLAGIIVSRTMLIVLMGLDALSRVLPDAPVWHAGRRLAFPGALLVFFGWILLTTGPAWTSYRESRLEEDDLAPFIASQMNSEHAAEMVVLLQSSMLERLKPYLRTASILLYPDGEAVSQWLSGAFPLSSDAWLLYDNGTEFRPEIHDQTMTWIDSEACPIEQYWYGSVLATHFVVVSSADATSIDASFEDDLGLVAATGPTHTVLAGEALCLRLTWKAVGKPQSDYAVFAHVLGKDGQAVSQSDRWPARPTSSWSAGDTLRTEHGLILPSRLQPGEYTIVIGLYAIDGGARLPLVDGSDSFTLGSFTVRSPET